MSWGHRLHSRREALAGLGAAAFGLTVLTVAGCGDLTESDQHVEQSTRPDSDRRLVLAALAAEQAALAALSRTRKKHRSLRKRTVTAMHVHQEHVTLLEKAVDQAAGQRRGSGQGTRVPGRPEPALEALVLLEANTSAQHIATALAAHSGAFARVMASMSAAAAQLEESLRNGPQVGEGTT